ncbi:M12 family metallo-peptidase [Crenothrix sp.]|uniref:M12 family metallo-peptidase n=1 Tax=Crenothrix sp. TaxID=3100433 RepID=UPI00374C9CEE
MRNKTRHYSTLLGAISLASIAVQPALAQEIAPSSLGEDFKILHHEPLNNIRFSTPEASKNSRIAAKMAPATTVSLKAFGKQFDLALESNDQLVANLPTAQKNRLKKSMQLYKGKLTGVQGSWARINKAGEKITGAFWDGKELYIIDSSDDVAKALAGRQLAKAASKPYSLIYKLSETESDATCALDPKAKSVHKFQKLVGELQTRAKALPATARQLDVAIVTDAKFTQANSANPQAAVVARMNVVDGIYSDQVGVHINVSEIRALTNDGAMTSTSSTTLLNQFSSFTKAPGFNNPGIAHLFTSRNIDGSTVGIAYIGALCSKAYGVGLSQITGTGTAGALTVAHEMGHNFGAPHDAQSGSACASTPGNYIMNPFLNNTSQFSPCSLQQMSPNIASAACLTNSTNPPAPAPAPIPAPVPAPTPTGDSDLRPVFPVNPINTVRSQSFNYPVEVRNGGTGAAVGSIARVIIPSGLTLTGVTVSAGKATCTRSATQLACNLGSIAANTARTITLKLKAGATVTKKISAVQVASGSDNNKTNNVGKVVINVR